MDPLSVLNKWKRAIGNIDTIFQRAMLDNKEEIIDTNVAQLEVGKDSLGNLLLKYESDAYAEYKQFIGSKAPLGIADLILEGDFTGAFEMRADGPDFILYSTDEKYDHLRAKYGEDIFGLSENSVSDLSVQLNQSFINHFRNELL